MSDSQVQNITPLEVESGEREYSPIEEVEEHSFVVSRAPLLALEEMVESLATECPVSERDLELMIFWDPDTHYSYSSDGYFADTRFGARYGLGEILSSQRGVLIGEGDDAEQIEILFQEIERIEALVNLMFSIKPRLSASTIEEDLSRKDLIEDRRASLIDALSSYIEVVHTIFDAVEERYSPDELESFADREMRRAIAHFDKIRGRSVSINREEIMLKALSLRMEGYLRAVARAQDRIDGTYPPESE